MHRAWGVAAIAAGVCLGAAVARAHVGIEELGRELDAEVAKHPGDAEPHLQRAKVHLLAQEWDFALAELDEATAHGAAADVVGTTRGEVFLGSGRPRDARAEFERVLRRRPDAYGTLFERGRAWLALGKPRRAADDFGRAIAGMKAPRPEHVIARRDALLSIARREDAIRALDEGMQRIGSVASLELAAIDLELELGRPEAALTRIERLLAATPRNPVWVARRAELLEQTGKTDAARAEYARALAMIDARPAGRRAHAFDELRQRLASALAKNGEPR